MNQHLLATTTPTAELTGVSLAYAHGAPVLNGLDWRLLPGQVVGLLGRNGAGKTTLLETMLGLRQPQSGSVLLFEQPVSRLDDPARSRIGYVPQQSDLFDDFTPAQLLAYFRSFYPRWNEAKVDGLMSRWDIARDKRIARLSVGQQQRLSIIRALAHDPDLLVLDEPVSSLDPAGRRDFLAELVEQVMERGTTVVFSTHILSDLERVAFNLAFMNGGRIALQAPLDELLDEVRVLTGLSADVQALLQRLGAQSLKRTPMAAGRERVMARLPAGTRLPAGAHAEAVTLDDLFMELT
jgi:ABC-2 type transport system ATP-binding protein